MSGRWHRSPRIERRSGISFAALLPLAGCMVGCTVGCMVGPNHVPPDVTPPAAFKSQAASQAATMDAPPVASDWWRLYGDPELDALITTATASNQTLIQAVAAVDAARAQVRIAGSFRVPTVTLSPTFTRERTSPNVRAPFSGDTSRGGTFNDWVLPVDLSYEIDVWGRVRRTVEAARAQSAASADDAAMVRLTVQTDVAQFYYALRLLDAQAAILAQTVEAYREQVRLLSVQVKTGLASPIVPSQAETQLESTVAQARDVQRARAVQEHALAILCGQSAPAFSIAVRSGREATVPDVPAGLPAMLLTRRPDVAAAEQAVAAANAEIGVAMAAFYPQFNLSSFFGFESANLDSLLDWRSRVASIVPGVTLPIVDGGRRKATLAVTRAQHRQAVAAYVNQVLTAYADVEDALTDLHAYADETQTLRRAVGASREYLRVAQVQFKIGLADYLPVLDAARTLLANELALAQSSTLRVTASIRLIRALGGGWDSTATALAPSPQGERAP